jgi:hypothetical protein
VIGRRPGTGATTGAVARGAERAVCEDSIVTSCCAGRTVGAADATPTVMHASATIALANTRDALVLSL